MDSRAELWPTATLMVVLLLNATFANAGAREFDPADPRSEGYPAGQALRQIGRLIADQSGERSRIRVFHSRQPGEERGLAENNWPSLVTTDHDQYAGYDTLAERMMSPEFPAMSQTASQSLSMEKSRISGDPAIRRRVE